MTNLIVNALQGFGFNSPEIDFDKRCGVVAVQHGVCGVTFENVSQFVDPIDDDGFNGMNDARGDGGVTGNNTLSIIS